MLNAMNSRPWLLVKCARLSGELQSEVHRYNGAGFAPLRSSLQATIKRTDILSPAAKACTPEAARSVLSKFILPRDAPGQMSGLRLGLQEVTRRGLGPGEMPEIARLMRRVLLDGEDPRRVGEEVRGLRQRFPKVHYCF